MCCCHVNTDWLLNYMLGFHWKPHYTVKCKACWEVFQYGVTHSTNHNREYQCHFITPSLFLAYADLFLQVSIYIMHELALAGSIVFFYIWPTYFEVLFFSPFLYLCFSYTYHYNFLPSTNSTCFWAWKSLKYHAIALVLHGIQAFINLINYNSGYIISIYNFSFVIISLSTCSLAMVIMGSGQHPTFYLLILHSSCTWVSSLPNVHDSVMFAIHTKHFYSIFSSTNLCAWWLNCSFLLVLFLHQLTGHCWYHSHNVSPWIASGCPLGTRCYNPLNILVNAGYKWFYLLPLGQG